MIHILSWTTKEHQRTLSKPLNSKLKKIQGLFKDLHNNLRTFQGKMEFKDFSRLCEPCKKAKGLAASTNMERYYFGYISDWTQVFDVIIIIKVSSLCFDLIAKSFNDIYSNESWELRRQPLCKKIPLVKKYLIATKCP